VGGGGDPVVKIGVMFPGQGSQAVGMGGDVAARWPSAARRFQEASDLLGYDLARLCAEGPEERLTETRVAQPALYVTGFAAWEILAAEGVSPAYACGHSLGEYTACAAAGVISFAAGLSAVKARGEAMHACASRQPGVMAAVIGAKAEDVDAWVAAAGDRGPVVVANRNAPDQVIVSGVPAAVGAVEAAGLAAGVRVIRLKVAGAFHSPLMQEAADTMKGVLAGVAFAEPACPVIGNVAALPLAAARLIREELEAQLISPVRWDACVRALAGHGVVRLIECGPGRVLSGLVRKIDRSVKTHATGTAADLDETLAALKELSHAGPA